MVRITPQLAWWFDILQRFPGPVFARYFAGNGEIANFDKHFVVTERTMEPFGPLFYRYRFLCKCTFQPSDYYGTWEMEFDVLNLRDTLSREITTPIFSPHVFNLRLRRLGPHFLELSDIFVSRFTNVDVANLTFLPSRQIRGGILVTPEGKLKNITHTTADVYTAKFMFNGIEQYEWALGEAETLLLAQLRRPVVIETPRPSGVGVAYWLSVP